MNTIFILVVIIIILFLLLIFTNISNISGIKNTFGEVSLDDSNSKIVYSTQFINTSYPAINAGIIKNNSKHNFTSELTLRSTDYCNYIFSDLETYKLIFSKKGILGLYNSSNTYVKGIGNTANTVNDDSYTLTFNNKGNIKITNDKGYEFNLLPLETSIGADRILKVNSAGKIYITTIGKEAIYPIWEDSLSRTMLISNEKSNSTICNDNSILTRENGVYNKIYSKFNNTIYAYLNQYGQIEVTNGTTIYQKIPEHIEVCVNPTGISSIGNNMIARLTPNCTLIIYKTSELNFNASNTNITIIYPNNISETYNFGGYMFIDIYNKLSVDCRNSPINDSNNNNKVLNLYPLYYLEQININNNPPPSKADIIQSLYNNNSSIIFGNTVDKRLYTYNNASSLHFLATNKILNVVIGDSPYNIYKSWDIILPVQDCGPTGSTNGNTGVTGNVNLCYPKTYILGMFGCNIPDNKNKNGVFIYLLQREAVTDTIKILRIKKVAKSTFDISNKCRLYASATLPGGIVNNIEPNAGMYVTPGNTSSQLWNNMFNDGSQNSNAFYKVYIRYTGIIGLTGELDTMLTAQSMIISGLDDNMQKPKDYYLNGYSCDSSITARIKYARANEFEFFRQHYIRTISQQETSNLDDRYNISGEEKWSYDMHTIGNKVRSSEFFDRPVTGSPSLNKCYTYLDTTLDKDLGIHIRNWDTRDRCFDLNLPYAVYPFVNRNDVSYNPKNSAHVKMYKEDFVSSSITLLSRSNNDTYKELIPEGIDVKRFPNTHKVFDLNKLNSIDSCYYNACDSNLDPFVMDGGPSNTVPLDKRFYIKTLYLGIGYTQDQIVKSTISAIDETPRYYPNKGMTLFQYDNYADYKDNLNPVNVMPNFDSDFKFTS
jgi:hypothetical protein